jgi:hypothetical protein
MTGRELADNLETEGTGLKDVHTSGYSAEMMAKDFVTGAL